MTIHIYLNGMEYNAPITREIISIEDITQYVSEIGPDRIDKIVLVDLHINPNCQDDLIY